jgi:hypothetical protein
VRNKYNTRSIIKHPFWQMAYQNPDLAIVCINIANPLATVEQENGFVHRR